MVSGHSFGVRWSGEIYLFPFLASVKVTLTPFDVQCVFGLFCFSPFQALFGPLMTLDWNLGTSECHGILIVRMSPSLSGIWPA